MAASGHLPGSGALPRKLKDQAQAQLLGFPIKIRAEFSPTSKAGQPQGVGDTPPSNRSVEFSPRSRRGARLHV